MQENLKKDCIRLHTLFVLENEKKKKERDACELKYSPFKTFEIQDWLRRSKDLRLIATLKEIARGRKFDSWKRVF